MPWNLIKIYQRFGGAHCLHLYSRKERLASQHHQAVRTSGFDSWAIGTYKSGVHCAFAFVLSGNCTYNIPIRVTIMTNLCNCGIKQRGRSTNWFVSRWFPWFCLLKIYTTFLKLLFKKKRYLPSGKTYITTTKYGMFWRTIVMLTY